MHRILLFLWISLEAAVGYQTLSFTDLEGIARTAHLWYPIEAKGTPSPSIWEPYAIAETPIAGRHPLIILSHGYMAIPHQSSWLIEPLVSAGYIVVAPEHLDSDAGLNHWKRPRDISTLIDLLVKNPHIDPARIGMTGFSLGGATGFWLTGSRVTHMSTYLAYTQQKLDPDNLYDALDIPAMEQSWRDARVKAAFLMAPALSSIFDIVTPVPLMIAFAESDTFFVDPDHLRTLDVRFAPIKGDAGHFVFVKRPSRPVPGKEFLFQDAPGVDREAIQKQTAEQAVQFFRETL